MEIKGLRTVFPTSKGEVVAAKDVDLTMEPGQIIGLVGESGCGKSVTMLSILRLVPHPGRIVSGQVLFFGEDLVKKSPLEMRRIRGKEIAMIFQDPMTTLNPVFKVGEQIRESLRIHGIMSEQAGSWPWGARYRLQAERDKVIQLMEEVGIPSPQARYHEYPHQFSGGMQQRALIAIALACEPRLLLADEPTTALDVTIQAQILDLLRRINETHGTGIILVTHDLGVAAEFCEEIVVMYAGQIVERGPTDEVIQRPLHPYTRGLLRSIPRITREKRKLEPIPGVVPDLANLKYNCAFYDRCDAALPKCEHDELELRDVGGGRLVRCVLY